MPTVPIQPVEVSSVDDHGFKQVVSRKRNRNKKPAANGNLANGASTGDKSKGAAEETEKPDWETSLDIAAAKIGPSGLTEFLERVPDPYPPHESFLLGRFLDFYDSVFSGVPCPWLEMFKESDLSKLPDLLHVPLSYIPQAVYETSVDWLDKQHVSDMSLVDYVSFTFNFILCDLFYKQGGEVTGFFIGTKPGDPCKAEAAIFVTLAIIVRSKPHVLTRLLPFLRTEPIFRGQAHIPITVWLIAQASQDNLPVGLYSWAHNLLPLIPSNPHSRDLILKLVDKILEKPDALTILVDAPVWEGKPLIPPHSFGILLQLTFPATSARDEATSRFEAVYPLLKQVALAGRSGSEDIKQIFTISLKLAGGGNTVLAEEATAIAMWSLTENIDCWKRWENIYEKNLEASVALLKKLVDEWKDSTLGREAKIQQIFAFSLKLAREGNTVLAKEAIAIAIWSLTENIDCWKHWENIYEKNLEASVALLKKLVWQCKYSTLGTEAMIQQIFAFSLKLAGEGNPVLPKKITAIAIWSLTIIVDCLKHRGIVYYERKLKACVALLRKFVEKWKDHSLKLSSLPRDTLAGLPGSKAMKQITRNIFTFSLISAGEGNTVVSEVATAIAIWSLTENSDCWKHWENIYEKNLKASVALLKKLVDEWKDHSLKLSSSLSDTRTLSQTMKSFMLQNKKAITQKGANARLYKEADKYCKVILGRVSRGSSSLKGTTISAVVLLAAGALSALVISSNPVDYLEGLVFITTKLGFAMSV